jgi:hypothetical protein
MVLFSFILNNQTRALDLFSLISHSPAVICTPIYDVYYYFISPDAVAAGQAKAVLENRVPESRNSSGCETAWWHGGRPGDSLVTLDNNQGRLFLGEEIKIAHLPFEEKIFFKGLRF